MVHGGGAQLRPKPKRVACLKSNRMVYVSHAQTIPVVEDVLTRLNEKLPQMCDNGYSKRADIDAGAGLRLILLSSVVEALGYVGEPESVDVAELKRCVSAGKINIIHPLSKDHNGQRLNVNADRLPDGWRMSWARGVSFSASVPGVLDKNGHTIDTLTPERIDRRSQMKRV